MHAQVKGKIPKENSADFFHRAAFRRVFTHGLNFYTVRLPTAFVAHMKEEVPDTATLRGSSGGSWCVKVVKEEEGIFLEDGWEKFRDDHNLSLGDVLLFRNFRNWCFNVQVFGSNGLQRRLKDSREKENKVQKRKSDLVCHDEQTKKSRMVINENKIAEYKESEKACNSALRRIPVPNKQGSNLERANWKDPKVSKLFIDLCLEELAAGRKDNGNFTTASWQKIGLALKEGNNNDFTIQQLRNHWCNLKRKYTIWSMIVRAAGNTNYDPVENKVNWSSEQWEQHLKKNPEAKQFTEKSLEYPVEMMLLFDE